MNDQNGNGGVAEAAGLAREMDDAAAGGGQERMRTIIENLPIGVMLCSPDFKVSYVNPALLKILKGVERHLPVAADRVAGSSLDVFFPEAEPLRDRLGDPKRLPHREIVAVGPEKLECGIHAVHDERGAYAGALVVWELVTQKLDDERKAREAALRDRGLNEIMRRKVDEILAVVDAAAAGDLRQEVPVSGEDVVGRMGTGMAQFLKKLRDSVASIAENANALSSSSEELFAISSLMSKNADETTNQASIVASAAEQVTNNIQTVSSGAEEMSASIREIAKNAGEAAKVATEASRLAAKTNDTVKALGDSSREIGKVVKVITSIAEQTNLLALNATIEAARAGEAGKGFAVVANEVKELAKETAKATEEISAKIEAIQTDAKNSVEVIADITKIINQLNDTANNIASAVEQQTATTNEIARNVAEAAKGSAEISRNVASVAQAARSTSQGTLETQESAKSLSKMAGNLQHLVGQFKY